MSANGKLFRVLFGKKELARYRKSSTMIGVMNNTNYKLLTEIVRSLIAGQGPVILKPDMPHAQALLSIHKAEAARRKKV